MLRLTRILMLSIAVVAMANGALLVAGCETRSPETPASAEQQSAASQTTPQQTNTGTHSNEAAAQHGQSADVTAEQWAIFRGSQGLRGVTATAIPDTPELIWTFTAEGAIVSSPIVDDNRVYVGSDDGSVYCINLKTGEEIWSFKTEFLIEAPPFFHDGIVYVGSHDFFLYALDAQTGEELWKYETYEKIVGSANVVQAEDGRDLIVVGSHDAFVYALDAKTGDKVWSLETNDRVNGTLAVTSDNQIIFGGCDTIVYVVDGATGAITSSTELGGDCNIPASVAVADGTVYLGHHSREFLSIEIDSGEIGWRYNQTRAGFYSPPAVTEDRIVVGGRDNHLHCINRATGEQVWTYQARRKIDAGPVVASDRVIVGSGDGRLYMISLEDGSEIWSNDFGSPIFSSAAVVDGMIIVGANDGSLRAFGSKP